jgi:hypothetical protein
MKRQEVQSREMEGFEDICLPLVIRSGSAIATLQSLHGSKYKRSKRS